MKNLFSFLIIFSLIVSCKEEEGLKKNEEPCQCVCEIDDEVNPPINPTRSSASVDYVAGSSPVKPGDYICAQKDTECWSVPAYSMTSQNSGDSLFIFGIGHEQSLVIKFKFNGIGIYEFENKGNRYFDFYGNNVSYTTTIGMDVVMSRYQLENKGILSVTKHDEKHHIIEGTFEFKLKRQYAYIEAEPERMVFTSGKFKVHLPD